MSTGPPEGYRQAALVRAKTERAAILGGWGPTLRLLLIRATGIVPLIGLAIWLHLH